MPISTRSQVTAETASETSTSKINGCTATSRASTKDAEEEEEASSPSPSSAGPSIERTRPTARLHAASLLRSSSASLDPLTCNGAASLAIAAGFCGAPNAKTSAFTTSLRAAAITSEDNSSDAAPLLLFSSELCGRSDAADSVMLPALLLFGARLHPNEVVILTSRDLNKNAHAQSLLSLLFLLRCKLFVLESITGFGL